MKGFPWSWATYKRCTKEIDVRSYSFVENLFAPFLDFLPPRGVYQTIMSLMFAKPTTQPFPQNAVIVIPSTFSPASQRFSNWGIATAQAEVLCPYHFKEQGRGMHLCDPWVWLQIRSVSQQYFFLLFLRFLEPCKGSCRVPCTPGSLLLWSERIAPGWRNGIMSPYCPLPYKNFGVFTPKKFENSCCKSMKQRAERGPALITKNNTHWSISGFSKKEYVRKAGWPTKH